MAATLTRGMGRIKIVITGEVGMAFKPNGECDNEGMLSVNGASDQLKDACLKWIEPETHAAKQAELEQAFDNDGEHTGGSVDYYKVQVTDPTSGVIPYMAECNDIIEALGMNYAEGNAFKAIWRICAERTLGLRKKGNNAVYDAEKVVFFGNRVLVQQKRKA